MGKDSGKGYHGGTGKAQGKWGLSSKDKGGQKGKHQQQTEYGSYSKSSSQHTSNYKADLCKFFERGYCEKGRDCSFAHGRHELRSDPQGQRRTVEKSAEADVMSWLKERRECEGSEGAEFEKRWKAWCKANGVHDMTKPERVESIMSFRRQIESLDVVEQASSSSLPQSGKETSSGADQSADKSLDAACPKGHALMKKMAVGYECDVCGSDIAEDSFFYDCRACDYSLCSDCRTQMPERTGVDSVVSEPAPVKQQSDPEAVGTWGAWSRGVKQVVASLDEARRGGHLKEGLNPDWNDGSDWYRLSRQAWAHLKKCESRCSSIAGCFLDAEGITNLVDLCVGQDNLVAVFHSLRLAEFFEASVASTIDTDKRRAFITAAFLGELLGADEQSASQAQNSVRDKAAEALVAFVCLAGFSRFMAIGVVTAAKGSARDASDDLVGQAQADEEDESVSSEDDDNVGDLEKEAVARTRRVEAQQQRRAGAKWDYTGGYRPNARNSEKKETNEEASLRMMLGRSQNSNEQWAGKRETNEEASLRMMSGRSRPTQAVASANGGNRADVGRRYKCDICIYHEQGRCMNGKNCTFAHGKHELRSASSQRQSEGIKTHRGPSWEVGPPHAF
eukprot:TRINITY_DN11393_c1_g1_i1.p1 TRINITY_DN11393_c1_g1~~TRINITY_DN11393_c1_g1_i1.p1  ORF type:complete len:638 (+),score=93.97 TRINITY_DN11393_c1_g1_i1:58-1914(+)